MHDYPGFFDPEQTASLSLKLQIDDVGSVTYVGVDLTKVGLSSLGGLVAINNKIPSLQIKGSPKATVSSQIDLSIPQTYEDQPVKAKYVVDPDTGKLKFVPATNIKGLKRVLHCDDWSKKLISPLFLETWLVRFFQKLGDDVNPTSVACMSKITLQTQFVLAFDVSGGANPIIGTSFMVPISGVNFDYNPQFTHSLTMAFSLKKLTNSELCTKIPSTQPNRTLI